MNTSRALGRAIIAVVGADEIAMALALGLVSYGFWDVYRPAALIVPGLVLLWMFLPPRRAFIERPIQKPGRRKA